MIGTEFTGERVIPGQVDDDLLNEHMARYHFARRLSRNRRVLDLACGTGYGAAAFTSSALRVVGLDRSAEAIAHAASHYTFDNLRFLQGDCTAAPLRDRSFDLVTAFEVIEHLDNWPKLLEEARRLLAPSGQFIVSTPNRAYYAESRRLAGPNPFHVHEFDYGDFAVALRDMFPHVAMFVQNHSSAVVFQPVAGTGGADLKLETTGADPETAHFFLAVCALAPQVGGPAFVFLPSSANVLREREHHVQRLEQELAQKDAWLQQSQREHKELVDLHAEQKTRLEASNRWAEQVNAELAQTQARVVELQDELAAAQRDALDNANAYEAKLAELNDDIRAKVAWQHETETRLQAEVDKRGEELADCVALLDKAERTVEERTLWAQRLEEEKRQLEEQLSMFRASRWTRLGRTFGLGPPVE